MVASVQAEILFRGKADEKKMAAIMRQLRTELVSQGMRYVRQSDSNPDQTDQTLALKAVMLEDDLSPYLMMLEPRYSEREQYHFVTVLSGSDLEEKEIEPEWQRLCGRLDQITNKIRPSAAIAWGTPSGEENSPISKRLALGEPPLELGIWCFLSQKILDENLISALEKIVGAEIDQTEIGVTVRLGDRPGIAFDGVKEVLKVSSVFQLFDPMSGRSS